MVGEGDAAPDFELVSDSGDSVRLSSFRGKPVVLFFYPRSDTPGCTRQACGIRDAWDEFERRGAVVLGVSSDTQAAQARFRAKYELPYPVLADPDHVAGEAYSVTKPDSNSFERSTFVIAADGTITKVMRRVKPDLHTDQVLAALPT
jgi:thioredoxin-dependent peroxiredoxin